MGPRNGFPGRLVVGGLFSHVLIQYKLTHLGFLFNLHHVGLFYFNLNSIFLFNQSEGGTPPGTAFLVGPCRAGCSRSRGANF